MATVFDLQEALEAEVARAKDLPCHVEAFCSWILADDNRLRASIDAALNFSGQARHPEHVAALGYGLSANLLSDDEKKVFFDELIHLSGRTFFVPGRPLHFEEDGISLFGVTLGASRDGSDKRWLENLLKLAGEKVSGDEWFLGLVRSAQGLLDELFVASSPLDLVVALASKGVGQAPSDSIKSVFAMVSRLPTHSSGASHDAVRLAVFRFCMARAGHIAIASTTREDLVQLLKNISRSMRLWTFETEKRTSASSVARWDVENEYHVQNLLWSILAPLFPDLENEENLPSLGFKHPRSDLAIPSLKTIIEVKFLRSTGQSAYSKITEEIAADASLYLSNTTAYDNIIAFVWDDRAQTEQHHELTMGLEAINGVSAAIVLPRPAKMVRPPT